MHPTPSVEHSLSDSLSATFRPLARPDVRCTPLPDGSAVLYDPATETAYAISESAALVWELCDGAHGAAAITEELATVYDAPADIIARDVAALLDRLLELGLLERAGRGTVS